jgi:hypothetical protein
LNLRIVGRFLNPANHVFLLGVPCMCFGAVYLPYSPCGRNSRSRMGALINSDDCAPHRFVGGVQIGNVGLFAFDGIDAWYTIPPRNL